MELLEETLAIVRLDEISKSTAIGIPDLILKAAFKVNRV
jgi:hypothetical protein